MPRLSPLLAFCLAALAAPVPVSADTGSYQYVQQASQARKTHYVTRGEARIERLAIARYGPFRVLNDGTAALVGSTDARSPGAFRSMMNAHPEIATLRFVECPGTYDDHANLALGRLIRAAGLAAVVPDDGSVRSGAVELLLAATSLQIDDGAEFAVHAWADQHGYEATDYPADSPENRKYLTYYREMGMTPSTAAAFYAMTNSVPFEDPRWMSGSEMRGWVGSPPADDVQLAYLDLRPTLN